LRIIARLDVKNSNLIKSINLEGLKVIGDPNTFAKKYYEDGADELIFMDLVASLYNRNSLHSIIKKASENIFIPLTVGGGIRSVDDALKIFDSGADKIAVNTAAVKNPKLIYNLAKRFGSQAIVISIEAKKKTDKSWEVYIESGREQTGIEVESWVKKITDLGGGEILLTSIDQEGTGKGFDEGLIKNVTGKTNIPVIASGGFGKLEDVESGVINSKADAIAIADAIHYEKLTLRQIRDKAINLGLNVRNFNQ
tara:strand:- start:331 stop:1089 length:759 start_codon:yes stop_codon:yes gene_type:complete